MTEVSGKANIYDVARLAEVSHQTVSRVLNDHASIRPDTRARVKKAMATLGYRPSFAARALASSKTKILGILSSGTDFTGPAAMVHFMELAAREAGFTAVTVGVDPTDSVSAREGIEHLMNLGVEGLAIVTPQVEIMEQLKAEVVGIPAVTIDSMYRVDSMSISLDNFAGGASATEHLIDLGHKNILHVRGPLGWFESTTRESGFTSTMLKAGLRPQVVGGDWELETGYRIGMDLDVFGKGITAVFLANDRMALGFMHSMRERNIGVPTDLSVVGFDDLEESAYSWPPLTTMRQDFRVLGSSAMNLLLSEISGEVAKDLGRIVPELIIRKSAAPPRARDHSSRKGPSQ